MDNIIDSKGAIQVIMYYHTTDGSPSAPDIFDCHICSQKFRIFSKIEEHYLTKHGYVVILCGSRNEETRISCPSPVSPESSNPSVKLAKRKYKRNVRKLQDPAFEVGSAEPPMAKTKTLAQKSAKNSKFSRGCKSKNFNAENQPAKVVLNWGCGQSKLKVPEGIVSLPASQTPPIISKRGVRYQKRAAILTTSEPETLDITSPDVPKNGKKRKRRSLLLSRLSPTAASPTVGSGYSSNRFRHQKSILESFAASMNQCKNEEATSPEIRTNSVVNMDILGTETLTHSNEKTNETLTNPVVKMEILEGTLETIIEQPFDHLYQKWDTILVQPQEELNQVGIGMYAFIKDEISTEPELPEFDDDIFDPACTSFPNVSFPAPVDCSRNEAENIPMEQDDIIGNNYRFDNGSQDLNSPKKDDETELFGFIARESGLGKNVEYINNSIDLSALLDQILNDLPCPTNLQSTDTDAAFRIDSANENVTNENNDFHLNPEICTVDELLHEQSTFYPYDDDLDLNLDEYDEGLPPVKKICLDQKILSESKSNAQTSLVHPHVELLHNKEPDLELPPILSKEAKAKAQFRQFFLKSPKYSKL